jgi:hypothetical protein
VALFSGARLEKVTSKRSFSRFLFRLIQVKQTILNLNTVLTQPPHQNMIQRVSVQDEPEGQLARVTLAAMEKVSPTSSAAVAYLLPRTSW